MRTLQGTRTYARIHPAILATFVVLAVATSCSNPTDEPNVRTPAAPDSVTLTPGDQQLDVAWRHSDDDGGGEITHTLLEISTDDRATWNPVTLDDSTEPTTSFTLTNLKNFTRVDVRVASVNPAGRSGWTTATDVPRSNPTPGPATNPDLTLDPGDAYQEHGDSWETLDLTHDNGETCIGTTGDTTLCLGSTMDVDPQAPTLGFAEPVTLRTTGFDPGSSLEALLFSTPTRLSMLTVDDQGVTTTTLQLPSTVEPGDHILQVRGRGKDGAPVKLAIGLSIDAPPGEITHVTIDPPQATLTQGGTTTFTATVHGSPPPNQSVTWSTSNATVATIDQDGRVTALEPGTTTITARSNAAPTMTGTATLTVTPPDDPQPTTGELKVTVNTPGVTVTIAEPIEQTVTVDSAHTWSLTPGTYTVTATKNGFTTPAPVTTTVQAGETTTIAFLLSELEAINGNVDTLAFTHLVDENGHPFSQVTEVNYVKDNVIIIATQTQEKVCVAIDVTNEDGEPLQNAPVWVHDVDEDLAIHPGPCASSTASQSHEFMTDQDGRVAFHFSAADGTPMEYSDVTKLLVTVQGADNVMKVRELKAVFVDVTHLYQGDELHGDWVYTDQRVKADMGTITSTWQESTGTNPADNTHDFWTGISSRQAPGTIEKIDASYTPYDLVMKYVITNSSGNVTWDYDRCEENTGMTCTMSAEDHVTLVPANDPETFPIFADVTASLWLSWDYGTTYEFILNDYSFRKQWTQD